MDLTKLNLDQYKKIYLNQPSREVLIFKKQPGFLTTTFNKLLSPHSKELPTNYFWLSEQKHATMMTKAGQREQRKKKKKIYIYIYIKTNIKYLHSRPFCQTSVSNYPLVCHFSLSQKSLVRDIHTISMQAIINPLTIKLIYTKQYKIKKDLDNFQKRKVLREKCNFFFFYRNWTYMYISIYKNNFEKKTKKNKKNFI